MSTKYAQIVIGPAGSGKSTYIRHISDYFKNIKRTVHCINLDPAADDLQYEPVVDVRTAINVKEIMNKYGYGPNGGLIYCMEQIVADIEWIDTEIGEHDYDYLLISFPGQIELFSHLPILPQIINLLTQKGYHLVAVFLLDSQFIIDPTKFLSAGLVVLSAMTMLEIPHLNVLSKCDLLSEEQKNLIESYLEMDTLILSSNISLIPKLKNLTNKICELIDEFNMIQFQLLDLKDIDSIFRLETQIDLLLQYYDNADLDDNEFQQEINQEQDLIE